MSLKRFLVQNAFYSCFTNILIWLIEKNKFFFSLKCIVLNEPLNNPTNSFKVPLFKYKYVKIFAAGGYLIF